MNIKDSKIHNFGGFELDTDKIGTTSTSKREIRLTYTGKLPEPYDSATILFRVTPECVAIVLRVQNGKRKPTKYVLEVSREEINAILWPLLWFKAAETEHCTRFDNGLSEYWNGYYQAEFTAWHTIGESPTKIISIMQQLSLEKRASLYRMIDYMRSEEVAAE